MTSVIRNTVRKLPVYAAAARVGAPGLGMVRELDDFERAMYAGWRWTRDGIVWKRPFPLVVNVGGFQESQNVAKEVVDQLALKFPREELVEYNKRHNNYKHMGLLAVDKLNFKKEDIIRDD